MKEQLKRWLPRSRSSRRKVCCHQYGESEVLVFHCLTCGESDDISLGLDPHASTPVEILHVFLLGFLKYFWRDVITRLDDRNKERLIARLSSVNTRGLGIPPIGGRTLVQYCGSLTGRDFRVISQAAPFVLYGLDLPADCIAAWIALTSLVPLAWQPEIEDLEPHLVCFTSSYRSSPLY